MNQQPDDFGNDQSRMSTASNNIDTQPSRFEYFLELLGVAWLIRSQDKSKIIAEGRTSPGTAQRIVAWLGCLIPLLACSFVGYYALRGAVAQVTDAPIDIISLRSVGQLITASASFIKNPIHIAMHPNCVLDGCYHAADHSFQGVIEAGVNLDRLPEDSIEYDPITDTLRLRLPSVTLTSCRIDERFQYNFSISTNPDWQTMFNLAEYVALTNARDEVLERGLLREAELNAKDTIKSIIEGVTSQTNPNMTIDISFAPSTSDVLPLSCEPDAPRGWVLNEANGEWYTQ